MSAPSWSCPDLGLVEEVKPHERRPDAARLRLLQRIWRACGVRRARTRRVGDELRAELPNGREFPIVFTAAAS